MAEQKKLSVAEILAAARNKDGTGAAAGGSSAPSTPESEARPVAAEPAAAAASAAPKLAPGERPKVSDILALARAGKAGAPAAKGAAPAAQAPAVSAPAAKPKAAAPAEKAEKPVAAGPVSRDTASILAAARKKEKPGPLSKAEAAAAGVAAAVAAKPKPMAPPMPPKPAYAQPAAKAKPAATAGAPGEDRRNFLGWGFSLTGVVSALWTLAVVKFMFPNVLREPPSKFKVGFPDAFPPGQVEEKYKAQYGVWIVNTEYNGAQQIVALKTVCTHLGCTPNWLEAEQKFKCPCHGSGFYKDGINFEGPAPRPLERYLIRVADDGQIEVDKSRIFQEEMGQWSDASCYIPA